MMQAWGHTHVSSAYEVYLVLSLPPRDPRGRSLWRGLLSIEPPVWGGPAAATLALKLAACGHRVWSWDDHSVVYSDFDALPPSTLRYEQWPRARSARDAPAYPRASSPLRIAHRDA
jgi:hypothetical protein